MLHRASARRFSVRFYLVLRWCYVLLAGSQQREPCLIRAECCHSLQERSDRHGIPKAAVHFQNREFAHRTTGERRGCVETHLASDILTALNPFALSG